MLLGNTRRCSNLWACLLFAYFPVTSVHAGIASALIDAMGEVAEKSVVATTTKTGIQTFKQLEATTSISITATNQIEVSGSGHETVRVGELGALQSALEQTHGLVLVTQDALTRTEPVLILYLRANPRSIKVIDENGVPSPAEIQRVGDHETLNVAKKEQSNDSDTIFGPTIALSIIIIPVFIFASRRRNRA